MYFLLLARSSKQYLTYDVFECHFFTATYLLNSNTILTERPRCFGNLNRKSERTTF